MSDAQWYNISALVLPLAGLTLVIWHHWGHICASLVRDEPKGSEQTVTLVPLRWDQGQWVSEEESERFFRERSPATLIDGPQTLDAQDQTEMKKRRDAIVIPDQSGLITHQR